MLAGDVEEGVRRVAEGFQEANRDQGIGGLGGSKDRVRGRSQRRGRGVRFGEFSSPRPVARLRPARVWALKADRRRLRTVGAEGRLDGEGGHDGDNVRTMSGLSRVNDWILKGLWIAALGQRGSGWESWV